MRNVFEWLGMKKEEEVIKSAQGHLEKVYASVQELQRAVDAFIAGNVVEMRQHIHLVAEYEHEADLIRRGLMTELAQVGISPTDRGDLITLVTRIDAIADWAHTADRLLALWEGPLPEKMGDELKLFMGTSLSSVEKLKSAVLALGKESKERILDMCSEVEAAEEVADDQRRELLRLMIHTTFDAAHMIIFHDLIESIEGISDAAEVVADSIRILAVELD